MYPESNWTMTARSNIFFMRAPHRVISLSRNPRKKRRERGSIFGAFVHAATKEAAGAGLCSTRHPGLSSRSEGFREGEPGRWDEWRRRLTWPGGAHCVGGPRRGTCRSGHSALGSQRVCLFQTFFVVASAMVAGSAWLRRRRWPGIQSPRMRVLMAGAVVSSHPVPQFGIGADAHNVGRWPLCTQSHAAGRLKTVSCPRRRPWCCQGAGSSGGPLT